jgi:hypothetical protein
LTQDAGVALRAACWLWWPVLVAHWIIRELFGGSRRVAASIGAVVAAGGLLAGWDGGGWSLGWRLLVLAWIAPQGLLVAWKLPGGERELLHSQQRMGAFGRVVLVREEGEQPHDPLADGLLLVAGLGWWVLCLTAVAAGVWPGGGPPWTRIGVLGLFGAMLGAAEYDPRPPPMT